MAEKLYYSMGEVSELFDVAPSLIRYWTMQFAALKPKRNKKGNRMFTPADVDTLKLIYHLVKEQGMTLDGAKRALRNGVEPQSDGRAELSTKVELLERLQSIRAQLLEVRESLKAEPNEIRIETPAEVGAESAADTQKDTSKRAVGRVTDTPEKPQPAAEEPKSVRPFYEQTLF